MACDNLRAALKTIQDSYAALEKEIADTPAPERAAAQKAAQPQLAKLNAQIGTAAAALNNCLAALQPAPPQRVAGAQPKEILAIQYQNPNFGGNGSGNDWAGPIAGGTFPRHQGFEWKQVMDTANEYDTTPAGASGWIAYPPDIADVDFMFLHPFGKDWEFSCVLDPPYLPLLSQGNINATGGTKLANDLTALGIPQEPDVRTAVQQGLLGVECDGNLVPTTFQAECNQGDRVAVFGRWIVDCGHDDFHTEIHPPLLLGSASVYKQPAGPNLPVAVQFTRALFISRPYLVGQTFSTSTDPKHLYNDTGGDDGHFFEHMGKEADKAKNWIFDASYHFEAHPKIKQYPFQGPHLFPVIVRTTEPKPVAANLVVSFHFTIRSGCSIEVVRNDDSSVRVYFALNSVGYTPPPLPSRQDLNYSLADINRSLGVLDTVGSGLAALLWGTLTDPLGSEAKQAVVLARGVKTDTYAALPTVDFRNSPSSNQVTKAAVTAIAAGQGITVDNSQPYPISGWVEVQWSPFDGYVRFRSGWQGTQYINIESGTLVSGDVQPGWWSADWVLESPPTTNGDPAGEHVYWIRNRWQSDQRLNIESGKVLSSVIQSGWLSARWTFEPVPGTDQYQIKNVWQPAQYLNIESGALIAGPIDQGWWSARWNVEQAV